MLVEVEFVSWLARAAYSRQKVFWFRFVWDIWSLITPFEESISVNAVPIPWQLNRLHNRNGRLFFLRWCVLFCMLLTMGLCLLFFLLRNRHILTSQFLFDIQINNWGCLLYGARYSFAVARVLLLEALLIIKEDGIRLLLHLLKSLVNRHGLLLLQFLLLFKNIVIVCRTKFFAGRIIISLIPGNRLWPLRMHFYWRRSWIGIFIIMFKNGHVPLVQRFQTPSLCYSLCLIDGLEFHSYFLIGTHLFILTIFDR